MKRLFLILLAMTVVAASGSAMADEGMWTLNHLPVKQLQKKYGFTPTPQWVRHVQLSALRLAGGCSGSFVSADGLVMTNHHCANACLSQLSGKDHNYMQDGFMSKDENDEPKCPDIELNQLVKITDVTAQVNAATAGRNGAARIKAQRAVDASIEKACVAGQPGHWRCDVVTLYHGGRYALYKYRRFQDVRLVFAPEQSIAFFGGDPDNFNFPRYDLDVTFLRAYVDGKPAHTPNYFHFDPKGPKAGELSFVVGNPGSTQRETPWIALQYLRNQIVIPYLAYLSEERGLLWEYSRVGSQQAKEAQDALFGIDNTLKVFKGWLLTLTNPKFEAMKKRQDTALRAWIDASPARMEKYGHPWKLLDKALHRGAQLRQRYAMITGGQGFGSKLYGYADMLVEGAVQRAKPDAERLPAYRDASLPALLQRLKAETPFYPQYDETRLAWTLEKMRQALGADDPFVHEVLGRKSPDQLARELVDGSRKLADPSVRMALWKGGEKAIHNSEIPMIELARRIQPIADKLRREYENQVEAPMRKASEAIAQARLARDGTSGYPDATFTLRLSYGTVKGWMEKGKMVPPFTHFAGLYRRATGAPPFQLPESWIKARPHLDLSTPMDFVTDNDIIGGNSGSPVINREGRVVGLIFDGNIHSLGGNFYFNDADNRAVAVDTAALDQALRKVYHQNRLAEELEKGHR